MIAKEEEWGNEIMNGDAVMVMAAKKRKWPSLIDI
jgi:hypothetical protein